MKHISFAVLLAACVDRPSTTDAPIVPDGSPQPVSQCGNREPLKRVLFGDLHVHTSHSLDSFGFANRNDPVAAYAFARGALALPIASGSDGAVTVAKLDPPLDFAAITDHSEFLSLMALCGYGTATSPAQCAALADQGSTRQTSLLASSLARLAAPNPEPLRICQDDPASCALAERTAWDRVQEAAQLADDPCTFSSLIGYEWTATTGGANLHRNVIFGSDSVPEVAHDYLSFPTALALWQALEADCREADGCAALTIPHNSNFSRGRMWDTADDPVSRDYMKRYQKLAEIYQHKGASECLAGTAFGDASCDFESLPNATDAPGFLRDALARGLTLARQTGSNPLALGIIGSTDTHNGAPGSVGESQWAGHGAQQDDTAAERLDNAPYFSPGGLAAVWAEDNTRASIFAALDRRETYATSGPRIVVRAYALAGIPNNQAAAAYCSDPTFPAKLVEDGAIPMGGTVGGATAPYVFVSAMADRTALESFDIVRIHAASDQPAQHVEVVALAGGEQQTFCRFWRDPDFVPGAPALYYARVFEQPTARWTARDCRAEPTNPGCADPTIPQQLRERAWTSPIFVVP
ncbi:MAG: DUF3604 domain-containing protein [Myxococcales bacterium]|nr:DUF3604 domain-containing protein [Myxococcales bacterium]